jgi:hypothetical protein
MFEGYLFWWCGWFLCFGEHLNIDNWNASPVLLRYSTFRHPWLSQLFSHSFQRGCRLRPTHFFAAAKKVGKKNAR